MKKQLNNVPKFSGFSIVLVTVVAVTFFVFNFVFAQTWQGPAQDPPAGNTSGVIYNKSLEAGDDQQLGADIYIDGDVNADRLFGTITLFEQICLPPFGLEDCITDWDAFGGGGDFWEAGTGFIYYNKIKNSGLSSVRIYDGETFAGENAIAQLEIRSKFNANDAFLRFVSQADADDTTEHNDIVWGDFSNTKLNFVYEDWNDPIDKIVMTLTPDGGVGIGTTNPERSLSIVDNLGAVLGDPSSSGLTVENIHPGPYAITIVEVKSDNAAGRLSAYSSGYWSDVWRNRFAIFSTPFNGTTGLNVAALGASQDIRFITGGDQAVNERMVIEAGGNVGIGTTNPGATLDISGSDTKSKIYISSIHTDTPVGVIETTSWGEAFLLSANLEYDGSGNPNTNALYVNDAGGWATGGLMLRLDSNVKSFLFYTAPESTGGGTLATLTEQMRITADGVGVGTSVPDARLHVVGDGIQALYVQHDNGSYARIGYGNIGIRAGGANGGRAGYFSGDVRITGELCLGTGKSSDCIDDWDEVGGGNWEINGNNIFYNSGKVAIGTSIFSGAALTVKQGSAASVAAIGNNANAALNGSIAIGNNAKALSNHSLAIGTGAEANTTAICPGNSCLGYATALGWGSRAFGVGSTAIHDGTVSGQNSFAAGAGSSVTAKNSMQFNLTAFTDGTILRDSTFAITGRNLGVVIGAYNPGNLLLAVNGSAGKPGGGSWLTFSDIRLKDITGEFTAGLSEILELNPIKYFYKKDNELRADSTIEYVGLVAQEVENLIPEAITKRIGEDTDKEYLMLNNDPIIFALINAIQEQQDQINDLLKEISDLEN